MSFNATESSFEGFRLARRAPMALLAWSLAYVAFFVFFFVAAGSSLIDIVTLAEQIERSGEPAMSDLAALMQAYGVLMLWALPLSVLFGAVLNTAIARSVIRPEDRRFGYLRLGKDELRVLAVTVALGLLFFAASIVAFGLVGVVGGLATGLNLPFLWLPALLLGLAAAGGLIWLAVRLSLAVPITFAEKRIAIFDSFALTRGRLWPLLGMAVIAGVLSLLVALLGSVVAAPLNLMFGGVDRLAGGDPAALGQVLATAWPGLLIWVVVNAVLSAAQAAILYAPFSSAYLGIRDAQAR